MSNILSYINYFCNVIFGIDLLYSPSSLISALQGSFSSARSHSPDHILEFFILDFCTSPINVFSLIVWILFAIFTVNLLLVFPYKWIRSVIRRCRAS